MKITTVHLETGSLQEYQINKQEDSDVIDMDTKHLFIQLKGSQVTIKDKHTKKKVTIPEFCVYDMMEIFTILNMVHGRWCSPSIIIPGEPTIINHQVLKVGEE